MIELEVEQNTRTQGTSAARIKVLGVGGGGSNMVNFMVNDHFENITFIVANTDAQALKTSVAPHKIQIGVKSTKGLGAGANPEVGRRSAEEDLDRIIDSVRDADIVFLTGGLGGGTGTGALPVIARALREKEILTVAVVTKPFIFEGKRRMTIADQALEQLKREVDTLIVLPNQKLMSVVDQKVSLMQAFSMINGILSQFVRSIADIIEKPGHINVDFADIKTIMKQKGYAIIGTGRASGHDRAVKAAMQAISSPLLENIDMSGARGILINITGSLDIGLHELSEAASIIYDKAHEDATIVLGSVIDDSLEDTVVVTVIATGFNQEEHEQHARNVAHTEHAMHAQPVHQAAPSMHVQAPNAYAQNVHTSNVHSQSVHSQSVHSPMMHSSSVNLQPVYTQSFTQPQTQPEPLQPIYYQQPQAAPEVHLEPLRREHLFASQYQVRQPQQPIEQAPVHALHAQPIYQHAQEVSHAPHAQSPVEQSHHKVAEPVVEQKAMQSAPVAEHESIDLQDIDIPAIMRKLAKERQV